MIMSGNGSPINTAMIPHRAFAARSIDARNMYYLHFGRANDGSLESGKLDTKREMQLLCRFEMVGAGSQIDGGSRTRQSAGFPAF